MKNKKLVVIILAALTALSLFGCARKESENQSGAPLGTWWWSSKLSDEYLDFASDRGVTEIYYDSGFNQNTADFIEKANDKGIKVYWLEGVYTWIEDDTDFKTEMEKYKKFQATYAHNFAGAHLDVEPHQYPDWKNRREELVQKYVEFVYNATHNYSDIKFTFDIPSWLNDTITFDGKTQEAYKFVIDYAENVVVMSYRDTAEKIYAAAEDEFTYAKKGGKLLYLSCETGEEEDVVTFYQEGKSVMYEELKKLPALIDADFGFAIHSVRSWKDLKD